MSKVKAVIVVFLLVAAAGGGAFYGLNLFYQKQVETEAQAHLARAEVTALDSLRVDAFNMVQKLSHESGNKSLVDMLGRVPQTDGAADPKEALSSYNAQLQPVLSDIQGKIKLPQISVVSSDGTLLAGAPKNDFGSSLKGLPAVAECLAGVARDGMYELGGKLKRLGVAPVRAANGAVSGCLMASGDLNEVVLAKIEKNVGLSLALFLRQKPVAATTLPGPMAAELAKKLKAQNPVAFGNPAGAQPLLIDLNGRAYLARVTQVPGGTDPVHLAVVADVGARFAALQEAQMMIIYATGGLLVFGLILGLLLSGGGTSREAVRLRDSLQLMAESGNGYTLDDGAYSGVYRDIALSVKKVASRGGAVAPGYRPPETVSQILASSEPPPQPAAGQDSASLDFESLLGDDKAASAPPSAPPPAAPAPQADAGFDPAPSPSQPPAVASAPAAPAPAPAAPPAASGPGPKVEMPGDLASFFDDDEGDEDQDATREFDALNELPAEAVPPSAPPPSAPPPSAPPPMAEAPAPPIGDFGDGGPMMDLGEDEFDDEDSDDQISSSDYRPDATVIAQVPDELLKAATDGAAEPAARQSGAVPPPPSALPSPPVAAPPVRQVENPEEAHFKEVFAQFVQTKKRCGEPTGGLTEDKFVEKLRKNTADLKGKYNCKTVRFQVYEKNGKAALKATPIK